MHLTLRRLLLLPAMLLLVGYLYGQTAVVTGTITHRNGSPAVNVTVSVSGLAGLTDVRGRYRVSGVPYGSQTLKILQNNKVLKQVSVNVNAAAITHNEAIP